MIKPNLFDPEKLSIIEYRVLKGNVEACADFDDQIDLGYKLTQSFELGFNFEAKLAKCELIFNIETVSKDIEQEEAKGIYQLFFIFKIENFEQLVTYKDEDQPAEVDIHLAQHLAAISYSTSRGILLMKLQGTPFHKFMLPIVRPHKLLEDNNIS